MIKRPFVFLLLAFVIGCILTKCSEFIVIGVILVVMTVTVSMICIFRITNRYVNHLDQFLLLLPLLIFMGFFLMSRQQAENPMSQEFDQKVKGYTTGTIERIVKKGENRTLYLKGNQIQLSKNSRSYSSKKIIVYTKKTENYKIGNVVKIYGEIRKFLPASNPGGFDEALYYKINGIDYKIYEKSTTILNDAVKILPQTLYAIRNHLVSVYTRILDEKNAGTVSAMLLGEKALLEQETKDLYQENGITHILAISGFHVALIGLGIYKLLCMTGCGTIPASFLGMFFVYCYGLLTDFSVSTSRAVMMLVVFLFGNIIGRTYDMVSATAFSALLILFLCPMEIYDPGFSLSYGAILAIAYLVPTGKLLFQSHFPLLYEQKSVKLVIESVLLCGCIQLVTTPLVLYYFYEIPLYSIFVNLLIIPPMALLTWLTIVGGLFGVLCEGVGRFLIGGAYYILEWYEWLCRMFAKLPGHMLVVGKPTVIQVVLYYVVLILFIILVKKNKNKRNLFLLLALLSIFVHPKTNDLSITFLDVSQGDAIVIQTPNHHTYLMDGGSSDVSMVGTYRILPYLKSQGIRKIDYVFLSHADADHTNGIAELLAQSHIPITGIILPDVTGYEEMFADLIHIADAKKIRVMSIAAGEAIYDEKVEFHCLAPEEGYRAETSNKASMVLRIAYQEFHCLLTGDLEGDEEQKVKEKNKKIQSQEGDYYPEEVDVLKVAHHGSKHSTTSGFLSGISPEIAVVSAGRGNRYGHPHDETIARLKQEESLVLSTITSGGITCTSDGISMKIFVTKAGKGSRWR